MVSHGIPDLKASRAKRVIWVIPVLKATRVRRETPARRGTRETRDCEVTLANLGSRGREAMGVNRGKGAFQARKAPEVWMVPQDRRGMQGIKASLGRVGPLARIPPCKALQGRRVRRETPARRGTRETRDFRAKRARQVTREYQGHAGLRGRKAKQVLPAPLACQDPLDSLGNLALMGRQGHRGTVVNVVNGERRGTPAHVVNKGGKVSKGMWGYLATSALPDPLVPLALVLRNSYWTWCAE